MILKLDTQKTDIKKLILTTFPQKYQIGIKKLILAIFPQKIYQKMQYQKVILCKKIILSFILQYIL